MIVWLASFPRSGNTFLRVVLHAVYGVPTYSIYDDNDPVAQRVGPMLLGYRAKPASRHLMTDSQEIYFVKTHKRRKSDRYAAIYLVRDGRDAVVSMARLRTETDPTCANTHGSFERLLREEIVRPYIEGQPSSGSWGGNVLSWLNNEGVPLAVLKYEDLICRPREAVQCAVSSLNIQLAPIAGAIIPSFGTLHELDPGFFRRGAVGSHRDEMPEHLHELFWAQPENEAAMQQLSYLR